MMPDTWDFEMLDGAYRPRGGAWLQEGADAASTYATAVRAASSGWSSRCRGAPNSAIIASPMYLSR